MNAHCFDTSALLEITHDGPHAVKFEKALAKAETVIISSISMHEMARYLTRVSGETLTEQVLAFLQQYQISPVTTEIAARKGSSSLWCFSTKAQAACGATCIQR
jgi:uncharacterized protein with PIN domain